MSVREMNESVKGMNESVIGVSGKNVIGVNGEGVNASVKGMYECEGDE